MCVREMEVVRDCLCVRERVCVGESVSRRDCGALLMECVRERECA